jgi:hypothetical protein
MSACFGPMCGHDTPLGHQQLDVAVESSQGAAEKNKTGKRRTSAPARNKKYVRAIFYSIFFGVYRQGEFENTGERIEYVFFI